MAENVGVAAGHEELLLPGQDGFEGFFGVLAREGLSPHRLDGPLTPESLQGLGFLLLGGPLKDLEREETLAVLEWVEAGGSLLVALRAETPGPGLRTLLDGVQLKPAREDELLSLLRLNGWALDPGAPATHVLDTPDSCEPASRRVAHWPRGTGAVCVLGVASELRDRADSSDTQHIHLACRLVSLWRHRAAPAEVARRRTQPQRHRLLQGYPMAHHLRRVTEEDELLHIELKLPMSERPCIVGVLPHPFCNPAVKGCGFCTFPQEAYRNTTAEQVAAEVARELSDWPLEPSSSLFEQKRMGRRKPVEALYFGGGTANLTPPEPFRALCRAARDNLSLVDGAEVTLEGVPIYFTARKPSLMEVLREELPGLHHRISMGIQTFDDAQLARMGRSAIGGPTAVEKAVSAARGLGFSTSGDLLFNLPGQSRAQMLADVDRAIELGLDQVCVYHLVLFEGLGTEWSKNPAMLAALPANTEACANWLAVRERLLERGFVQVTLTNFERAEVRGTPRSFRYEPYGFSPERYDVLGFGPAALNVWIQDFNWGGVKTANPETASEYLAARGRDPTADRFLALGSWDLRLLYLTRKVALLGVDRAAYRALFQSDPLRDFGPELTALLDAGLLAEEGERLALTPEGMFYADTIAGTLAWQRVKLMRALDAFASRPGPERQALLSYDVTLDASLWDPMG